MNEVFITADEVSVGDVIVFDNGIRFEVADTYWFLANGGGVVKFYGNRELDGERKIVEIAATEKITVQTRTNPTRFN